MIVSKTTVQLREHFRQKEECLGIFDISRKCNVLLQYYNFARNVDVLLIFLGSLVYIPHIAAVRIYPRLSIFGCMFTAVCIMYVIAVYVALYVTCYMLVSISMRYTASGSEDFTVFK